MVPSFRIKVPLFGIQLCRVGVKLLCKVERVPNSSCTCCMRRVLVEGRKCEATPSGLATRVTRWIQVQYVQHVLCSPVFS